MSLLPDAKKCSTCLVCKPTSDFHRSTKRASGLQPACKPCQRETRRAWRTAGRVRSAPGGPVDIDLSDLDEPVDEVLTDAEILKAQAPSKPAPKPDIQPDIQPDIPAPTGPLKRVLIVPDTHVPYEDGRAWNLMLKCARDWKPDTIVILGDFGDFYSVSSHDKRPDRVRLLDDEVASINVRLTELDGLNASEKYFIAGNHEDRLERYLTQKAPELFNLVKVRDLFKLDSRGWKYTPYKQSLKLGKLNLTHDCGNAGGQAHTKALGTFQHNIVIGHTHRMSVAYEGNAAGESHVGAMFGWLGDVKGIDYMHQVQALRGWQLGFGVGWMEESGVVHLAPVPMVNYACVLEGKLYRG